MWKIIKWIKRALSYPFIGIGLPLLIVGILIGGYDYEPDDNWHAGYLKTEEDYTGEC